MRNDALKGSKGGSSSSPTQASDSLSSITYAQILDLISEGPIFGPATGTNPAQSVYLNGVPLQNPDGSNNFVVDGFDFRYGEIDQTYISGFASSSQETSVGVEFKQVTPWNVVVTDLDTNSVIITLGVNALSSTDSSTGDVTGYVVDYQIQLAIDGGAYNVVVNTSFNGKASAAYERSHVIPVSGATSQYAFRVVRTTADTTSVFIADTTTVVSYTQVIDAKLRYPLSSLCAISVDAVQFSSLPTRSYDMKGLLIKYPSNYNPTTRAYTGTWDGTFVTGWTDNPAWIFYDLVLNTRYGLGQWVDATMVDRYALYTIAQYCDVIVSDGAGGIEPRFTCNCYIQSRADAYKVIQDLASVFRGMAYWAAGNVVATCDMPSDPVYVYTAANTIGGQFKYVGSSLKTRYTVSLVTWNDPSNAYQQAVEYVEDIEGIARYGINKSQITAFGCTSRGQAQRVGHWSIITSRYETNSVTFSVGLDGTLAQPGQIIAIADQARAARRLGGRVHSTVGTNQVTLDRAMPEAVVGNTLTIITPAGIAASSTISAISGATYTVNPAFPAAPVVGSIWMIGSTTVQSQLFRVLSVADKGGISFDVTATQYEPGKYAAIDDGAAIDVRPISGNTFTTQVAPTGITVNQYVVVDQGIAKTNMTIAWVAADSAVSYTVQWQKDNGTWVDAGTTGGLSIDVTNIYSGTYEARVMCRNGMGIASVYAYSSVTTLAGKTGAPPVVSTFTASTDQVFAIRLNWSFPATAGDTAYTEIYYSHTNDFTTATQLGIYSYPTSTTNLLGLVAGYDMYFWARLVDTSGNVGAFYPPNTGGGVHGESSSDATAILAYLTGQITATQLASSLATPIAAIPGMQTAITANASAITSETTSRVAADAVLSSRIDTVSASLLVPEAGSTGDFAGATTVYAGVYTEQSARAEADLALAAQINNVSAQVNTYNNAYFAAVQTETTARISADAATASQLTTVQTQVNANSAAVATNASAYTDLNGRVAASYTIRTQVTTAGQTYIAGVGIGIDNTSGTVQSQVLVTADRFAVLETTGNNTFAPFVIQGGQAFINSAFIGNAYITNAMIANAAITTAKIANATITNAQIATATITQANIANAAIGTAQIQNASIVTAHIGTAQIDTLRLGANSATSTAYFSIAGTNSTTYTSAGGVLVIFVYSGAGTVRVQFNGGSGSGGLTMGSSGSPTFSMFQPAAGAVSIAVDISGGGSTGTQVLVMEYKR